MNSNASHYSNNYEALLNDVKALCFGEADMIANMANISAVIFNGLADVNWAGFYILKDEQLVLGPFQGKPACIRIPLGKGVCGTAAKTRKIQIVDDVHAFSGHIACDSQSASEIVVPILLAQKVIGVLDIDSPSQSRFTQHDADYLSKVVDILTASME